MKRGLAVVGVMVGSVMVSALPAAASADETLGTVTQPAGSTANACTGPDTGQILIDTGGSSLNGPDTYSGTQPMALSQWQVNATGAVSGGQVTLVVFTLNLAAETISVIATDTENVNPAGLPADDVATFAPATPITVQPGDLIGLYLPSTSPPDIPCYWSAGSIPNSLNGLPTAGPPTAGATISPGSSVGLNKPNSLLNLGATLTPLTYDAALSMSAGQSNAVVGQPAVVTATVTNDGPDPGPVTFTDPVPSGLTVQSAGVGSGTCATNAAVNIVTCTTGAMTAGQSTKVVIVVVPAAAQSYTDPGTISLPDGGVDPNAANNNASATLAVGEPAAQAKCVVPKLGGASVAIVKRVLPLLGCGVGKVKKSTSKTVPKGEVISTNPRAGTYAAGRKIAITVSSGKPRKKRKK